MAGLVVGGQRLLVLAHRHRAAFGAHQDLVAGAVEMVHAHVGRVLTGGEQCRLVDQVGQVRAGEAGRAAGHDHRVHVLVQRHLAHVHLEDLLAALHVRQAHHHLAVKAARAQQRRVQHVGAVGGGDHDHALPALEAVHFHQQLVEGLLALIVAAAQAGAAMAADGVDLVDEDDARRVLLGLLEHVAHARGAHADEHLDEVGAGDREERHLGLAGDGARQQGLAGARRADHQHAARDLAAQLLELGRITQELDQLGDFLLGLVAAGDVGEGDLGLLLVEHLGPRLAERHRALAAALLHLPHHEEEEADDQQDRQEVDQDVRQRRPGGGRRLLDGDVVVDQVVDHALVAARRDHRAARAVGALERNRALVLGDVDAADPVVPHLFHELRILHFLRAGGIRAEALEHHHQDDGDDHPEQQILDQIVHSVHSRAHRRHAT